MFKEFKEFVMKGNVIDMSHSRQTRPRRIVRFVVWQFLSKRHAVLIVHLN